MLIDKFLLFLHSIFLWFQGLGFRVTLRALRRAGHEIPRDVIFGRNIHIDCPPGAHLKIGSGTHIGHASWIGLDPDDTMVIGENVFVSQHVTLAGSISIGKDSLIAGFVTVVSDNHAHSIPGLPVRLQGGVKNPVVVGQDVWIGTGAVILPGVTIGDHAVIGANSTVTRSIETMSIAVGSPARQVGMRNDDGGSKNNI